VSRVVVRRDEPAPGHATGMYWVRLESSAGGRKMHETLWSRSELEQLVREAGAVLAEKVGSDAETNG
jgi:hypothetical protein